MKHHLTIDEETMGVLRKATITGSKVTLGPDRLDRALYENVNKALVTAGGKWTGKLGKGGHHAFTCDPRAALGMALTTGTIKDEKKASQAFYTPRDVAERVVMYASVKERMAVLEPSAGRGALSAACLLLDALVDCVEMDPRSVEILCSTPYRAVVEGDFLKQKPNPVYDRVVMNPPFTAGQDVDHVTHAFDFLKPGGRLVAIMAPGWEFQETKRAKSFRALVEENGYVAERLPAGAFKESGTNVATLIVILDKPTSKGAQS